MADFTTIDCNVTQPPANPNGSSIVTAADMVALAVSGGADNASFNLGQRHSLTITGIEPAPVTSGFFDIIRTAPRGY